MSKSNSIKNGFWDRLGIGLSGACAIHCMLVPVFIALIPLWPAAGRFHDYTHLIFFIAIAPTVWFSLRQFHSNRKVTVYLTAGVLIIFAAWALGGWLGMYGEAGVTLAGSSILIHGHWLNYKAKSCAVEVNQG